MLNYSWSEDYSVGNSTLDEHHQTLLDMFNRISLQLTSETNPVALLKLLSELKDYTAYHFSAEEKMMKEAAYPDLEAHIHEHNRFEHQLEDTLEDLTNDPQKATEDLFIFLSSWLINHIQKMDMAYKGKM